MSTTSAQNKSLPDRSDETSWWNNRWVEGRTGWDLGGPHPHTEDLIQKCQSLGLANAAAVLLPGCGRAHDGALLARKGLRVTATDISSAAIAEATTLYGSEANLTIKEGDALTCPASELTSFDLILDRAMLCALRPELRPLYLEACSSRLRPGGLFAGILFARVADGIAGPPFAIASEELVRLFGCQFEILVDNERFDGSCDDRILAERIFIARRIG